MGVSEDWTILRESIHGCLDEAFADLVTCVIRQDQDGPRPDPTYAAYKINPYEQKGGPEYIYLDDGNIKQIDRYALVISIQTYGKEAMAAMMDARRKIRKKSFRDFCQIQFNQVCLSASILGVGDIIDVTEVIATTYEQRAQMDLRLSYAQVTIDSGICEDGLAVTKIGDICIELNRAEDDPAPLKKVIKEIII